MAHQAEILEIKTELADIPGTAIKMSRVAIGTWSIGGWMWGGTDETESVSTIRAALTHGINLIDTAPGYGFGRSEEIVGKAIGEAGKRLAGNSLRKRAGNFFDRTGNAVDVSGNVAAGIGRGRTCTRITAHTRRTGACSIPNSMALSLSQCQKLPA